jgi:acetyl-CoA carboxylase beta subunit
LKNGGDGELQQAAVAAKSGGGGGELERDRGAFNHSATLVTVLAAVQNRDVRACACSSEFTGGFLGLDRDR